MSVLTVSGLFKSYKKGFIPKTQKVLNGVDFSLHRGKITGFLGGNGAGKTTTIKCLLGLSFPDAGTMTYFDGQPLSVEVKARIGFLPERPYFYDYLTGKEFLRFYGQVSTRLPRRQLDERIDNLLKRVDLTHSANKRLRTYSKGMLQKVGLAQALIHEPELVILDEPKSGLDPDGRQYLSDLIREVAKNGTTVFFSSHLLHDAETLCENLVILSAGKVIYDGRTDDLLDRMGKSIELTYTANGLKKTEHLENSQAIQIRIDRLRADGAAIDEIKVLRTSLEEAFIKIALRGEKI
jgi:ABC-2 type transport system ATP-binding protein